MSTKKVAIVGAAGFLGLELVKQLEAYPDFDLYAVTRDNGNFLLQERKIQLISSDEIDKAGPFDIVVNLAYPTVPSEWFNPIVNKQILGTLKKLCNKHTRLIHTSTQAVFGFGMEHKVENKFLSTRRDFSYIEAKLEMEQAIRKNFPAENISIVRLGNIWGVGSGVWTAAIADKLLFGGYVGVENEDGYTNMTDVKNAASYLVHLVKKPALKGTNIYHLAEFSHIKWSEVVSRMSKKMKVEPVYSDVMPSKASPFKAEIGSMIKGAIGGTWAKMNSLRVSYSYLRSAMRVYGAKKFEELRLTRVRAFPKLASLDYGTNTFLLVMTGQVEFKTITDNDWVPPISFEESWQMVENWMKEIGYID